MRTKIIALWVMVILATCVAGFSQNSPGYKGHKIEKLADLIEMPVFYPGIWKHLEANTVEVMMQVEVTRVDGSGILMLGPGVKVSQPFDLSREASLIAHERMTRAVNLTGKNPEDLYELTIHFLDPIGYPTLFLRISELKLDFRNGVYSIPSWCTNLTEVDFDYGKFIPFNITNIARARFVHEDGIIDSNNPEDNLLMQIMEHSKGGQTLLINEFLLSGLLPNSKFILTSTSGEDYIYDSGTGVWLNRPLQISIVKTSSLGKSTVGSTILNFVGPPNKVVTVEESPDLEYWSRISSVTTDQWGKGTLTIPSGIYGGNSFFRGHHEK